MTDKEIERDIREKLTVPLWPTTGRALGLGRNATYAAAQRGEIETIAVKKRPVSTAWLRRKLGLDDDRAA
jgi:hypothetical protein